MEKTRDVGRSPEPLKASRQFNAPRATVFKAWTSAEHVAHWFSPEHFSVPQAHVEPRVGGAFEVCMRAPDGTDHWMRGRFVEFVQDERLVIDMRVSAQDGAALFTAVTEVVFADGSCGGRVDIVQTYVFEQPELAEPMVKGAAEGWRMTLDKLGAYVLELQGARETGVRNVVHAMFRIERTYGASAGRVWKALTDPAAKSRWFGSAPGDQLTVLERAMDVRPGGAERLKGRWRNGVTSCFDAVYHDVIENERLVYSYEMHMDDKKISVSLATMELKPEGAGVRVVVTEQGAFLDGYDDAGAREHGTGMLLDALGRSLAA